MPNAAAQNVSAVAFVDDSDVRRIEAFSGASLKKRFRRRRGSALVRRSALGESSDSAAQANQRRIYRGAQE